MNEYNVKGQSIGQGLYLKYVDVSELGGNNKLLYRILVDKEGKLINKKLYREGGMFTPFGDKKFCGLIEYDIINDKIDFGIHVIINTKGEVVLKSKNLEYPNYIKGVIGTLNKIIYNLETGEEITAYNESLLSKDFLFAKNNYNKDYVKGVYKINFETGEYEIFN